MKKTNQHLEEINGNKYFMLIRTDESKKIMKKYEKLWSKIVLDFFRVLTDNSDEYTEKYLKIEFNLDDGLPVNKTLELPNMINVIRFVLHKGNKYYAQA